MLIAALILIAGLGAAQAAVTRRYPMPLLPPQPPIGPMTPTFQERSLRPAGPILRVVTGGPSHDDVDPLPRAG